MKVLFASVWFWAVLCFVFLIVVLFIGTFVFRQLFSRRFWCLTFWTVGDVSYGVVSSGKHLIKPSDESDHYEKSRRIWFETYEEAVAECNDLFSDESESV